MSPLDEKQKKEVVKLMVRRSWWDVLRAYEIHPETRKLKIPRTGETALHVALTDEMEFIAIHMVSVAGSDVLAIGNEQGDTPLHLAAKFGNTYLCKCIAEKDVALIGALNKFGETPLISAASHGKTQAFLYLHHLSKEHQIGSDTYTTRNNGDTILHSAISQDYFDLAYIIIKEYPKLMHLPNKNGLSPLHLLATKPSAFPSGVQFFGIRKLVYRCVRVQKLAKKPDLAKAPNPKGIPLRWNSYWRPSKGLTFSSMFADFVVLIVRAVDCFSSMIATMQVDHRNNQQDEESNTQGHGEIDQQDEEADRSKKQDEEAANEQVDHRNNQQDEESANSQGCCKVLVAAFPLCEDLFLYPLFLSMCIVIFVCFCPYILLRITFKLAKNIIGRTFHRTVNPRCLAARCSFDPAVGGKKL